MIAAGASASELPIKGTDLPGVFKMRTPDDAENIRNYAEENNVKKAVVIGAGFIGLEAAENLQARGINVSVIDFAPQILPNILDPEMAAYAKKYLLNAGIRVITGTSAEEILGTEKVTGVKTSAGTLACEMLIMAAGVRPNTAFLRIRALRCSRERSLLTDR